MSVGNGKSGPHMNVCMYVLYISTEPCRSWWAVVFAYQFHDSHSEMEAPTLVVFNEGHTQSRAAAF